MDEMREAIAKLLWERFSPEHEVVWPSTHAAEYRLAAAAVVEITRQRGSLTSCERHAPGPWSFHEEDGDIVAANGVTVCHVLGGADFPEIHGEIISDEKSEADLISNARLIESAPDLLLTLKSIRDFANGSKIDPQANFPAIAAMAESAIANAS